MLMECLRPGDMVIDLEIPDRGLGLVLYVDLDHETIHMAVAWSDHEPTRHKIFLRYGRSGVPYTLAHYGWELVARGK